MVRGDTLSFSSYKCLSCYYSGVIFHCTQSYGLVTLVRWSQADDGDQVTMSWCHGARQRTEHSWITVSQAGSGVRAVAQVLQQQSAHNILALTSLLYYYDTAFITMTDDLMADTLLYIHVYMRPIY